MRKAFLISVLLPMAALASWAQTSAQTTAPAKPSTVAKPPVHQATGKPTAIIETTVGNLTCTLFPDKAPIGVENFIGLATGTKDWKNPVSGATKHGVPLYNGTIFHRVIPNFMIQGGDPAGNGSGDPGYKFKNEVSSDLLFDKPGRLAYANSGPDTNGSQFFITEVAVPHLNGNYTIFGQCDEASVALVKIVQIKIVREGAAAAAKPATPAKTPASAKPATPSSPN
jgi:peptidyl-prolyl cis-trans isomerase A (cyclophilin A)